MDEPDRMTSAVIPGPRSSKKCPQMNSPAKPRAGAVHREQHTPNSIHINYFCYLCVLMYCYLSNSSRPEKNLALLRDLPFPPVFADETCLRREGKYRITSTNSYRFSLCLSVL